MKWLIASDIHGSARWCQALMENRKNENADRILLLGDLLYHGPRNDLPFEYDPKAVITMLNSVAGDVLCVRGNCDAEVDQMVLDFPITADCAALAWRDRLIFAVHGHLSPPALHPGDVLLGGHTHVSACEKRGEILYCNPGSVSLPKNGTPRGFMTFEDGLFVWKTLEGEAYRTLSLRD